MKTVDERLADVYREAEEEAQRIRASADRKARQIQERARRDQAARKEHSELRDRLEEEHGTAAHAKRDLLWSKAWEHGHSDGLGQVEWWYGELAELLED